RLLALELNYHELGGLYDRLAEAGQVRPVVLTADDIERATHEAPPGGRAAVRAEYVKNGDGWVCDWRYLYHCASKTFVDLRARLGGDRKVTRVEHLISKKYGDAELRDMLAHFMAE